MNIDFYVLDNASEQQARLFVCELIEKAHHDKQRVYIHTDSKEIAERLETLLWTFKEDSFIPHCLYDPSNTLTPIQIGYAAISSNYDVFLNFSKSPPDFGLPFTQLIEIVFNDPLVQQLARDRYKLYRDKGYKINTHKRKK